MDFRQIPLDHESALKTAFNTPYGRYYFKRLPFGIKSAPEIFHKAMDQMFSGCPCEIIVDDILVWGETEEEHDHKILQVLDRAREVNIKLKVQKFQFKSKQLGYVGHVLTSEGVKVDPEKVRAVVEMQTPDDAKSLRRFLGMVTYLSKFIPQLSEAAAPLRTSIREGVPWSWCDEQQEAFDKIKSAITTDPVLQFYDVQQEVTLTCDASSHGLGAACLQDGKPVAYASRALSTTQKKYAQIEKEMLAVVFACNTFHDYIYGRQLTIETGHKPLETLFKRCLSSVSQRLQKMMMQLQRYDLKVVCKKGSELYIADTLSRAHMEETAAEEEDGYEVLMVIPIAQHRMVELKKETASDPQLAKLISTVKNGWPEALKETDPEIQEFFSFREQLIVHDDIVYKGEKIVAPTSFLDLSISNKFTKAS